MRYCANNACGASLLGLRRDAKFCSDTCRRERAREAVEAGRTAFWGHYRYILRPTRRLT